MYIVNLSKGYKLDLLCSSAIRGNWTDSPKSMLPIIKELIAAGIRIWIFRYFQFFFLQFSNKKLAYFRFSHKKNQRLKGHLHSLFIYWTVEIQMLFCLWLQQDIPSKHLSSKPTSAGMLGSTMKQRYLIWN